MLRTRRAITVVNVAAACIVLIAPAASAQTPNVVIQWNQILQTLFGSGPSSSQRSFSMMHIAMFDAINSIEEVYTPYRVRVRASHGASPDVAAAQAARDVLAALFPAQQAVFDNAVGLAARWRAARIGRSGSAGWACRGTGGAEMAAERRVASGDRTRPHLRAAAHCRVMATDAACEQFCDLQVLRQRGAVCHADQHAVPARAAADADECAIHAGFQRDQAARIGDERRADG